MCLKVLIDKFHNQSNGMISIEPVISNNLTNFRNCMSCKVALELRPNPQKQDASQGFDRQVPQSIKWHGLKWGNMTI